MTVTLEVSNIIKTFGSVKAVNDITFSAKEGEVIALLGPNGAGKSTLMNMISGYLAPDSGYIKIFERDIKDFPLFSKNNIGFLPEGSPLYPDMSVIGFLTYMAELRGLEGKNKDTRLNKIITDAKIDNVLHQKIETLSKGYLRRVGFAQSILSDPPILLLDEPTDGLDPNQKDHIRNLIQKMGKNKTILISTHLLEEAETIATRIILMDKGEIKADGDLKQILRQQKTDTLAETFRKLTR